MDLKSFLRTVEVPGLVRLLPHPEDSSKLQISPNEETKFLEAYPSYVIEGDIGLYLPLEDLAENTTRNVSLGLNIANLVLDSSYRYKEANAFNLSDPQLLNDGQNLRFIVGLFRIEKPN